MHEVEAWVSIHCPSCEEWVKQLGLLGGSNGSAGAEFVELSPLPWGAPGECQVEVACRIEASRKTGAVGTGNAGCG